MRRAFSRMALVGAVMAATAGLGAAQSAEGVWLTEPMRTGGYAHIEVAACDSSGEVLCGRIVEVFESDRTDLVGAQILQDMVAQGQGNWGGGTLYSPDKRKHYDSRMALVGDGLRVQGCVAAICKGQLWARVR